VFSANDFIVNAHVAAICKTTNKELRSASACSTTSRINDDGATTNFPDGCAIDISSIKTIEVRMIAASECYLALGVK
jgi:hypothetical protein